MKLVKQNADVYCDVNSNENVTESAGLITELQFPVNISKDFIYFISTRRTSEMLFSTVQKP